MRTTAGGGEFQTAAEVIAAHRFELRLVDVADFAGGSRSRPTNSPSPATSCCSRYQLDAGFPYAFFEIQRVRVDDQLKSLVGPPEVEQRDARDVRRVGQRLEGRDRGRARLRIGRSRSITRATLVASLVVAQPARVLSARHPTLATSSGSVKFRRIQSNQSRVGEGGDQCVRRDRGLVDDERQEVPLLRPSRSVVGGIALRRRESGRRPPRSRGISRASVSRPPPSGVIPRRADTIAS